MTQTLIEVRDLQCAVAGRVLFQGLCISIAAGDLVEIWGPNGSGKSTLLRCMAGLFEADEGTIERGEAVFVYLGHKPGLTGVLSPLENLAWFARVVEPGIGEERIVAALHEVGLGSVIHTPCQSLSAGQARRAALARLAITGAKIWLLDEPLTALDDAGGDLLRRMLGEHRKQGGAAVCATHQRLGLPDARSVELGDT